MKNELKQLNKKYMYKVCFEGGFTIHESKFKCFFTFWYQTIKMWGTEGRLVYSNTIFFKQLRL